MPKVIDVGAELIRENDRMRDVLEEILKNCDGVLRGGLPHFSKRDLASTVADRARYALGKVAGQSESEGSNG